MAVVYKAHDNLENKTVAIKILKEEFVSNEEFLRRFKNESKAIAMLSHPNIVNVYDVSFGDLIQYIVMEYIEGITLKEFIEHEGSLRWKDAVHFTIQILKALQHAHDKGIVHRDVKPQNIMVLSDGTIKVTDFGIARFARSEQRTMTDKAIGSVHYISPEQARGDKTDEKADIYSVGVILYEMLTGRMPFQAENAVSVAIMQLQRDPQLPTEINGSIPLGLEQITMHAMQKTPERRYQSSAEMLCDLGQFRKDPSLTFEYPYFVDNSPTKFVGAVGVQEEIDTIKEPEAKEKNNIIPILAGVATAFVIALIVVGIWVASQFGKTGDEIKCPDFVGKELSVIKDNKEYKDNFKFEEKWEFQEDFAYGIVYQQSETKGENLKKGAKITLYVSKGQSTRKVPDVSGKTESAAVTELKSNGFKTKIVEMADEDTEKGLVVKTDPARTTTVAEGTEITVYISTGKPIKNAKVPDVVGLEKADAEKELKDEGFVPEIVEKAIYFKNKYYPIGYVFAQEPAKSSEELPEGTTVKLYVCSGYEFDIEFDIPSDLKDGKYTIELYENGKMIHKGDTISSAAVHGKYKIEKVVTKSEKLKVTVAISQGEDIYNLYEFNIDNKEGKSNKFRDLEKKYPTEELSSEETNGEANG
jgi:serine/threonine-protein kinase